MTAPHTRKKPTTKPDDGWAIAWHQGGAGRWRRTKRMRPQGDDRPRGSHFSQAVDGEIQWIEGTHLIATGAADNVSSECGLCDRDD